MVKYGKGLKESELRSEFEALLRALLVRVPFLELKSLKVDAVLSNGRDDDTPRPDWLADVRAKDRLWKLIVECRRHGQPREVRSAILQLKQFQEQLPANKPSYGVFVAPFISEQSARLCEEADIGYADLAGNARLSFDQVFVETRSANNPFRERRESRALFGPRAARVLRVLLQGPLHPWRVVELGREAGVSLGWVSAVRKQLLAREWAADEPGGLRVIKPGVLLDSWVNADDWEKRTITREYSLLASDPSHLAGKLKDLLGEHPHAFTQWFAGWLRHPYTIPTVVTIYVKSFPEESTITDKLLARRVSSGGGLRLVVPKDEGVLNPSQSVRGFNLVSDMQIYLDLLHAGLRGEEQAAELREMAGLRGRLGMTKFGKFDDYPPRSLESAEAALLTAWRSLERYHDDLVLIGGLAVHYLTRHDIAGLPGTVTLDVDFGITLGASGGQYGTIKTDLAGLGFASEGNRLVRKFGDAALYLDFLTEDPSSITGARVVDDVIASVIPGVNRALACRRMVSVQGRDLYGVEQTCKVAVADIGPLLVLKLNAFGGPTGRRSPKDAYDVLLAVTGFIDGPEAVLAAFRAEKDAGNPAYAAAVTVLRSDFSEVAQDGPARAADFHPGDAVDRERVRQQVVTMGRILLGA